MPSIQSMVLTDRKATPVNHTLVPVGRSPAGVATIAKGDGTAIGEIKLSLSQRRVNGKIKTRELFAVPVVVTETINGVAMPKVVRTAYVDCTFTFENTHTLQERNDVVGMFQSSMDPGKPLFHSTVVVGESIWG